MTSRRLFLQKLSAGVAIPSLVSFNSPTQVTSKSINHFLQGEAFWGDLRKKFPLQNNRVYLNNGTFGPSPTVVLEALQNSFVETNISGEYGHIGSEREKLAAFVGIKTSEISLTHNTTEGINIMVWGLPLQAGDEVIITFHEHVGNALPWLNRAKLHGIVLKPFEPKATQAENLDLIKSLVTSKTKVIAIPHVTCTAGLVFPIKEISAFARSKGIFTAIDGAHGAGTFDLNLKELGCDLYASSYHKWVLGPNGTGFLYVGEEILEQIQAYQVGAYSDLGWDMHQNPPEFKGYVPTAHRFDYGSQSLPMIRGAVAAANFHVEIGKGRIESRVRELNQYLFEGLAEMDSQLDILSPQEQESRISMVTFKPKNMDYQQAAGLISQQGFRIRQVPESKLDAIRISTHIYNSKEEIDSFLEVTKNVLV
ncbi:aminotransferase class V-fold PLP-dependent enzyme [Algoriphagus sp. AGSA1]|uniref:aminotransferase class V-fold PLP-dependent enzyme n=1 Tax=Algoriphagus sp. AGSA1 TaxID=2907213 RepID=UPI001F3C7C8F|nr:aminotransferase class V-fold PLP-dependent enzyme [Algoriphagus sp. AGSA1]MCE7054460.1 aminotransferase class V-fold PLP-dependent enzyme [Algoriphagus sp. AGSA1]